MKLHPFLVSAKKMLANQNFKILEVEGILQVSLETDTIPFCFLLVDEEQFSGIAISLASDFPDCILITDLVINLMHIANIAQGEPFFIDDNGKTYWGKEAQKQASILYNEDNGLLNLNPPTNSVH